MNRNHIYAGILYFLSKDLSNLTRFSDAECDAIKHDFERLLPSGCKLPQFDRNQVTSPTLGPLAGEHPIERYSRVNILLRSIQNVLAPSRWRDMFGKSTDAFPSTVIAADSIPRWMRLS